MNRERHQQATALFHSAAEIDPANRSAYLSEACGDDAALRAEVESMLRFDVAGDDFLSDAEVARGRPHIDAALKPGIDGSGAADDAEDIELPSRIGKYRPVRVIGQGGMGIVYEAQQDAPQRTVALKMIRANAMSRKHLRRFRLEAELLGRLTHPGIAQVYEAGTIDDEDGGQPYFAMELIDGVSLTKYATHHRLSTADRLNLFAQVCDAVQHAHQNGVVHRDLKPENVLVDVHGQVRVLDFGVARLIDMDVQVTTIQTHQGELIGTVPYMSPEQIGGEVERVDTRSDVYALGVVFFELLADRLPYDVRNQSFLEAARVIREDDPLRLGSVDGVFRGDLEAIATKALEKEPDRRYQSAAEMAADVRNHLAARPIQARPPSAMYSLRRYARRHRAIVIGGVTAVAALVIGLVVAILFAFDARDQAAQAHWANYRAGVRAVADAITSGDVMSAQHAFGSLPDELGGWERRYLKARLAPTILSREADSGQQWLAPHTGANGTPRAVLAGPKSLSLVDGASGAVLFSTDNAHREYGPQVAVSSDGRRIAFYNETSRCIEVLSAEGAPVGRVVIDPGSSSTDDPLAPEVWVDQLSLDARGATLACRMRAGTRSAVLVADVLSGTIRLSRVGWFQNSAGVAVSHDGSRVAVANRITQRVFDSTTGQCLAQASVLDELESIAWSADDTQLVLTSGARQRVCVCRADTLELIMQTPRLRTPPLNSTFSPDGRMLAVAHGRATEFWDIEREARSGAAWGPSIALAFDQSGQRLVTVGDAMLQVIDSLAIHLPTLEDSTYLYLVAFSPDDSLVMTAGFSGEVHLWDVLDGTRIGTLPTESATIIAMSFSDDGKVITTVCRPTPGVVQTWDARTLQPLDRANSDTRLEWLAAGGGAVMRTAGINLVRSWDGAFRVMARWPGPDVPAVVEIQDGESGRVTGRMNYGAHAVAISRDNALIALAMEDGVGLVDVTTQQLIRVLELPAAEKLYSFAFSPDRSRLVGAGRSGAIHFWDIDRGDLVCSMKEHNSYVHHVAFSGDGARLATASGDGTARLFDSAPPERRLAERAAAHARRDGARRSIVEWRAAGASEDEIADRLAADVALTIADHMVLLAR